MALVNVWKNSLILLLSYASAEVAVIDHDGIPDEMRLQGQNQESSVGASEVLLQQSAQEEPHVSTTKPGCEALEVGPQGSTVMPAVLLEENDAANSVAEEAEAAVEHTSLQAASESNASYDQQSADQLVDELGKVVAALEEKELPDAAREELEHMQEHVYRLQAALGGRQLHPEAPSEERSAGGLPSNHGKPLTRREKKRHQKQQGEEREELVPEELVMQQELHKLYHHLLHGGEKPYEPHKHKLLPDTLPVKMQMRLHEDDTPHHQLLQKDAPPVKKQSGDPLVKKDEKPHGPKPNWIIQPDLKPMTPKPQQLVKADEKAEKVHGAPLVKADAKKGSEAAGGKNQMEKKIMRRVPKSLSKRQEVEKPALEERYDIEVAEKASRATELEEHSNLEVAEPNSDGKVFKEGESQMKEALNNDDEGARQQ